MALLDKCLIYDVETTISNSGNPFDSTNKLVMSGFKWLNSSGWMWERGDCLKLTQTLFDRSTVIVGFNLKFDLHWARRIGVNLDNISVWDCQLAEFILEHQTNKYPSLNQACEKYDIPLKLDVVKTEYWEKGIDTDAIPINILQEYLEADLDRTEQVFLKQAEQFGIKI